LCFSYREHSGASLAGVDEGLHAKGEEDNAEDGEHGLDSHGFGAFQAAGEKGRDFGQAPGRAEEAEQSDQGRDMSPVLEVLEGEGSGTGQQDAEDGGDEGGPVTR
jgi:hypothetical protein